MIRTYGYRKRSLISGDELIALARVVRRKCVIATLRDPADPTEAQETLHLARCTLGTTYDIGRELQYHAIQGGTEFDIVFDVESRQARPSIGNGSGPKVHFR